MNAGRDAHEPHLSQCERVLQKSAVTEFLVGRHRSLRFSAIDVTFVSSEFSSLFQLTYYRSKGGFLIWCIGGSKNLSRRIAEPGAL